MRLDRARDVIEMPINDELDINGGDVDKALKLLYKSNPTVFEWVSSPIIYRISDFADQFKPIMRKYFSSRRALWHYLRMAERNYREYLKSDMVKAKKYFYALRPILACRWILERGTPPPMLFSELMETQLEEDLKDTVCELLDIKMNTPEVKMIMRVDALNAYLERSILEIKERMDTMPKEQVHEWEELNEQFLSVLEL